MLRPESMNRVNGVPGVNEDRHRIKASSVKITCAHGSTEKRCPPRGGTQGGPNEAQTLPPGASICRICCIAVPRSWMCSNVSTDTITSAFSSVAFAQMHLHESIVDAA